MRGAALALLLATAAAAETAPLATYHVHNGSLPPPYHRSTEIVIGTDGAVRLRACRGYGDEDCTLLTGQAAAGALDRILAEVRAQDLIARPARVDPQPRVGGGAESGTVSVDGTTVDLPGQPLAADAARVAAVLAAIVAAVPPDMAAAAAQD
jgi:hypothetical protein